jgi:hypothetical protein
MESALTLPRTCQNIKAGVRVRGISDYTMAWWLVRMKMEMDLSPFLSEIVSSKVRVGPGPNIKCSICCLLRWFQAYYPRSMWALISGTGQMDAFLAHLSWKLKWAILIAFCPSSVRPSVCLSVCKLLHFRLLLQNQWANFNQTWHKSSLVGGLPSLFKWRGSPFSKGR